MKPRSLPIFLDSSSMLRGFFDCDLICGNFKKPRMTRVKASSVGYIDEVNFEESQEFAISDMLAASLISSPAIGMI